MGNATGREEGANGVDDNSYSRSDGGGAAGDRFSLSLRPHGVVEDMANSPPASPSRSPSPHLFDPQLPAASLQIDHMLPGETQASANFPSEKGIPTLITWSQGGNNVFVEGSWDNWRSRKLLQKAGKDHALLLVLPSGIFHYRFIVDGETRQSPDLPIISDEMGNVCHVLDVHDYVPENLDSIAEFVIPDSPESSYNQDLPEEDDFSREPGLVPQQLHLTVLDVPKAEEVSSSRPQHIVLNHLYLEKGRAAQSVVALGLTHRFKSKYVTAVLYKPLQR